MSTLQILEKGEYTGVVTREIRYNNMLTSVSSYDQHRFNDKWHCHVNAHISFVLRGGCSERKKEHYERLPGKTTFYMAGEPHQILNMCKSTHINLELDEMFFTQHEFTERAFSNAAYETPDARFLMLKVYNELSTNDNYTDTSIYMLLLGFMECARPWGNTEKMPKWISIIHNLLHDRWNETLSLEDLSKAADVHPGTISYYFPKYFLCTLGTYMRKLKVERALQYIKSSDKPLTDIAYECGFFDQSHFIRTFKEFTGLLPSVYRRL